MIPTKPDDERDGQRSDELAAIYRAAAQEAPPPALDAKILAAARRGDASRTPGRAPRRWLIPLSLAATVLLGVGVVLRLSQQGALEREESRPATLSAPAPSAARREAPAAAETFAEERKAAAGALAARKQDATAGAADSPRAPVAATAGGGADVVSVEAGGEPGAYEFRVGIRSPDSGCARYADWWEVVSEDGGLLYRRVLLHSHVDEQPFLRAGGPVPVESTTVVWVRAHMNDTGYGGVAFKGSAANGFAPAPLPPDFAPGLARQPPLPDACAF